MDNTGGFDYSKIRSITDKVKANLKEKYAEFLSHVVSIHYLYNFPDVFLHESYYSFIKDTLLDLINGLTIKIKKTKLNL